MVLLSAAGRKAVDEYTINVVNIRGRELVENAARSIEAEVIKVNTDYRPVTVICGYGNNGADGLALARMLARRDMRVTVTLTGNASKATELWQYEWEILPEEIIVSDWNGKIEQGIIIDSVFGIGLNRDITGTYAEVIDAINAAGEAGSYVISADIPSGLSGDTGSILGTCVKADKTICMSYAVPGMYLNKGPECCGELIIADIGLADYKEAGVNAAANVWYDGKYPKHISNSHKGSYGRLYMLTGVEGMAGAAVLSAEAAYRAGTGLVYVDTVAENKIVMQIKVPEAVLVSGGGLAVARPTAAVAGCGLSKSERAVKKLTELLEAFDGPMVLDADALNIVSENEVVQRLVREHGNIIMTPHIGEMERLLGEKGEIADNLPLAAKKISEKYNAVCVAKAARTVVQAPDREDYFINIYGNAGMATAGSGDVLAGIIGGLLARGMESYEAAKLGVTLHAKAGDVAASSLGMSHMMARDIIAGMQEITFGWE